MKKSKNNNDQYKNCNITEIQGILTTVSDDHLEYKVVDIFKCFEINIDSSDTQDCYRLPNSTLENKIVQFDNQKFCKKTLKAKFDLQKISNAKLRFDTNSVLYFSENVLSQPLPPPSIIALLESVGN